MNAGWSLWTAALLALAVSALVGLVNGLLVAYLRIPAFVVTLGMLSVARSLAMVVSGNRVGVSVRTGREAAVPARRRIHLLDRQPR